MALTKFLSNLVIDGSGGTVLDVQGSVGQLFSVTDSLTGDLFAVSDISGIPILNVNSSGAVDIDGTLSLGDSDKIQLGASQDLQIYHDGTNSYISEVGTGDLIISADNDLTFKDGSGNIMANMNASNSVELMYGNSKKFETTSTGVTVSGTIGATNFSGSSSGTNTGDQTLPTASSLGAVTLTDTQTISGAKTFSSSANHYKGHLYYDSYDSAGNHYFHFNDGAAAGGTTVNWRQYYGTQLKTHTWTSDSSGNMTFTFQGDIDANGGNITADNLFLGSASVRLSPGANGEVGINYNTSATGSLVWYAGGTASKFNVTNTGDATFAGAITTGGKLTVGTVAATSTATTALFLGAANEVKKRSLGSNAFNSTSYLPLAGGTLTGQMIFPSAATTKPVLPNGYIARNDNDDTDGTHDIWGISERYYPSNATDADAWGIQWSGTPNEINFIGAGQKKLSIDLNTAGTVKIDGNAVATESYVGTAISNLVDSSPAALDTLNELAAALGDDASFSTTMSTALGNRLRIDVNNQSLSSTELANARTNLGLGTAATSAATSFVAVSGDSMTGVLGIEYNGVALDIENSANSGADTGIRIRGARNGQSYATDNLTSYILLSNFDDNTTPNNYDLVKIGGGMHDSNSDTGYFRIETNNGTALTKAFDIDKNQDAKFYGDVDADGNITADNFSGSSSGTNTGDQTLPTLSSLGGASSGYLTNTGGAKLEIQNQQDGGASKGIYMWSTGDPNWGIYMAQAGASKALNDGAASAGIDAATGHAIRFRVNDNGDQAGFIWENSSNETLMQLNGGSEKLYTRNAIYPSNQTTNYVDSTRIANWQTAHGWGNHADGGYLTSYTETSTLDNVADRGATTNQALTLGSSATSGGRILSANYNGSNRLGVISSEYSSGDLLLGYGAEGKNGSAGFVSTYGNFSGAHSVLQVASSSLDWRVDASNSQTAIGSDLTLASQFAVSRTGILTMGDGFTSTKGNTAHGWGNHASAGYLTSETFGSSDVVMSLSGTDVTAGESITLAGGLSYSGTTLTSANDNTTYTAGTGLTLTGTEFSVTANTYATSAQGTTADAALPKAGGTMTGALEINGNVGTNPILKLYNTSNSNGATIQLSDQSTASQTGNITFRHADGQSQGGGASFHFESEPDTVLVVGNTTNKGRFIAWSANSAAEVDYGFADDRDTGMVQTSSNNVSLVAGGVKGVGVGATAVSLKYSGSTKIATTTSGVTVTGDIKIDSALLSNQENTDVDTGTETVATVAHATYTAAFFDYVIKNGTNVRAGTVYSCHDGTNVEFTETSTVDLGDTSDVSLAVDISGTNMRLRATTTSDNWSVKSLVRAI